MGSTDERTRRRSWASGVGDGELKQGKVKRTGGGAQGCGGRAQSSPQPPYFLPNVHKGFIPLPVLDALAVKRL